MLTMPPADSALDRKARGAFFTPPAVARFIADWAIHSPTDAVLEPSCGEAIFLRQAGRNRQHTGVLVGIELHEASALEAERSLHADGILATINVGDFFLHDPQPVYDAVIGNPPYVRFHGHSGLARARSRASALRAGVRLTNLASSWASFTIHSALSLRPGGRLGLVLPAELLTVNYAAAVRQFLMDRFTSVGLVLFVNRVFPGVQEEVLLLLASGYDPTGTSGTDHCDVYQVHDADGLQNLSVARKWSPPTRSARWSSSLMDVATLATYNELAQRDEVAVLEDWGDTTLGMVTGNNKYFALSAERVHELKLEPRDLIPLTPPGSRHLRGISYSTKEHQHLANAGSATWLFRPEGNPSPAGKRYIKTGEAAGVNLAYKCQARTPWWRVPYLEPADLLLTYMNADTPRITTNRVGSHHLNSVHGIYLHDKHRRVGKDLLPIASLNSLTLLGAEIVGRSYGGGMLKIEPREADSLPVPSPELVARYRETISALRGPVTRRLREKRLLDAVTLVDDVVLTVGLGLTTHQVADLRAARAALAARRAARAKEVARS